MQLNLVEPLPLVRTTEDGIRTYRTPEGNIYKSVTTVLGQLSKSGIDQWKERVGEEEAARISNESSTIGNAMHLLCENYIYGKDLDTSNDFAMKLFNQLKPAIDEVDEVVGIELPLYSDYLSLAGTADFIGFRKNILTVLDFKNSRKPKLEDWIGGYYLQGACYARMFWELYGDLPKQITILVAVWDGTLQEFTIPVKDIYPKLIKILRLWHPDWQ